MYKSNMTRRTIGTVAIALFFATTVYAQQQGRIRGQVEKVDGTTYVLKARDGTMLNVKLADDARISALEKASLADIKNDTFIGISRHAQAGRQHRGVLDPYFSAGATWRGARPARPLGRAAKQHDDQCLRDEHGEGEGRRDADGEI